MTSFYPSSFYIPPNYQTLILLFLANFVVGAVFTFALGIAFIPQEPIFDVPLVHIVSLVFVGILISIHLLVFLTIFWPLAALLIFIEALSIKLLL